MWSQKEKLTFTVGGGVNGPTILEDSWAISYKAKRSITV